MKILKKKPFYIVLMVIATLVLCADIAIYLLTPSTQSFTPGQMGQSGQASADGNMPSMPGNNGDSSGSNSDGGGSTSGGSGSDGSGSTSDGSGSMSDGSTSDSNGSTGDSASNSSDNTAGGPPSMPGGNTDSSTDSSSDSNNNSSADGSSNSNTDDSNNSSSDNNTNSSSDNNTNSSSDDNTNSSSDNSTGSSDSNMPGNGSDSNMPSMPGNGSDSNMPSMPGQQSTGLIGVLMKIKNLFLPILIICILIDVLCAVRIFFLMKKQKQENAAKQTDAALDAEGNPVNADGTAAAGALQTVAVVEDPEVIAAKRKKSKRRKIMAAVAILLVVVLILGSLPTLLKRRSGVTETVDEELITNTASTGDIDTTLSGSGSLDEEDAEELTIPGDVEVVSYLVKNGDTVSKGDKLATVNTTSVMTSIAKLQTLLETLDEEIENCEDTSSTSKIKASADGRVMAIYAKKKEAVVDTMYDHEALMLLSLDGYLRVKIKTDEDLSVGDKVKVLLSDNTTVDGKVSAVLNGKITVLVSDAKASYKEEVYVKTTGGKVLGSGKLSINSELKVTGFLGTTTSVPVSVGDEVEEGDTLIKLKDTDVSSEKEALYDERSELQDQMVTLFQAYQDGCVCATCDGVVSGVDEDLLDESVSSEEETEETESSTDSTASTGSTTSADSTAANNTYTATNLTVSSANTATNLTANSANTVTNLTASKTYTATNLTASNTYTATNLTASKTYTATNLASSDASAPSTSEGYSNVAGVVSSISYSKLTVLTDEKTVSISDYSDLSSIDSSSFTEKETYTPDSSTTVFIYDETNGWTVGSLSDIEKGDLLVFTYDSSNELQWIVCQHAESEDSDDSEDDNKGSESSETGDATDESESDSGNTNKKNTDSSDTDQKSTDTDKKNSNNSNSDKGNTNNDNTNNENTNSGNTDNKNGNTPGGNGTNSSGDNTNNGNNGTFSGNQANGNTDNTNGNMTGGTGTGNTIGGTGTESTTGNTAGGTGTSITGTDGTTGTADTSTDSTESEDTVEGIGETSVCSVTPQDSMVLTISIDELDILSISQGQSATVVLDALEGQTFEGTVTCVDQNGSNNGGNTKYSVDVTIDRTSDMLAGMNASAVIDLGTTEDVVTIPEAALVEQDGATYVYTTYDEKNDELGGLKEVETGVSDGTNVQITDGLSEGDTYYYKYADSISFKVG